MPRSWSAIDSLSTIITGIPMVIIDDKKRLNPAMIKQMRINTGFFSFRNLVLSFMSSFTMQITVFSSDRLWKGITIKSSITADMIKHRILTFRITSFRKWMCRHYLPAA